MADNYIERHQEEYEMRKAKYLLKKKHLPKTIGQIPEKPEDEAL
ncbi:MAG: dehydrogenase [Prevotella sp.]|jgi:hypothetical protein|nr:dehydrogenase [Prevotella sp.]